MTSLRLLDVHRGNDVIVASCALDDLRFHVSVWYEDVDLAALARQYGDETIERICGSHRAVPAQRRVQPASPTRSSSGATRST